MLKVGIIGYNNGNGHPYSYSAIFNGFNKKELLKNCPYPIIQKYLIKDHRNKNHSPKAKATHLWTQNKEISKKIARVSKIPNIVNHYKDLKDKVDCVILARDDIENHFNIAKFFLEKKIPIFIDKQLVFNRAELKKIKKIIQANNALFFAGSTARYSNELKKIKNLIKKKEILSIHCISKVNWIRYAHHLLEPITVLIGTNIRYIRSIGNSKKHQIFQIKYKNQINLILEFTKNHHDIRSTFFLKNKKPIILQFKNYFFSFKRTLMQFIQMVHTKKKMLPYDKIYALANIVICGKESMERNGKKIYFKNV